MVFKKFYFIIIIRVLLILATCLWFSEALRTPANIYTLVVVITLLFLQIISLIQNINKVNRSISSFFDGIQEIGSSVKPQFKVEDSSFKDLSKSMGKVAYLLQETRIESERRLRYFEFVVENNPTGILIIDQNVE